MMTQRRTAKFSLHKCDLESTINHGGMSCFDLASDYQHELIKRPDKSYLATTAHDANLTEETSSKKTFNSKCQYSVIVRLQYG